MRSMRSALLFLLLAACGSAPRSAPGALRPSDVAEHAALPPGYELGERLSEQCSGTRGFRAIREERLLDVDCSSERLSRTLRARAAERGSRVLIGRSCRVQGDERYRVQCSASLGEPSSSVALGPGRRAESLPAPSPAQVLDLDEPRPQDGAAIRVSFQPEPQARKLAPRSYDRVAETPRASVGRRDLGQVSAHCERCDDGALRHALRVTAGRMGAGEVASIRCFQDEGQRCVATALEPWSF
jgi:hypothetical protein